MKAEIISVGTELLLGHIVNTNAAYLSRKLAELGIDVYHQASVGDNPSRLLQAIEEAMSRSDIVITTGGLGPTVDDITMEAVRTLIGQKEGVKRIRNGVGSAPGLIAYYRGKRLICLPGPPRELEPMFEKSIMPLIRKISAGGWILKSRIIKTTGLPESRVNKMVGDLLNLKPPTTVGIYARLGEVDLKIMAKANDAKEADRSIRRIERKIRARLGDNIFGYDDETLEGAVGKILTKRRKTIAVAESCTGGLLASRLTDISGSSKYFTMGVVAYANAAKEKMLGVSAKTIAEKGAVSKEVALEMAKGVRYISGVDIGVGITGIAGPTGAARRKPVGLVYIALATKYKYVVKKCRFMGSRQDIKFQASQAALELVRKAM